MTTAVCLRCGEYKFGAWVPCGKCGHTPETPEDQARHVMVSDHYLSRAQLEEFSAAVKKGEPLPLDESVVREFAREIPKGMEAGCGGRLLIGAILVGGALVGVLYIPIRLFD